MPIRERSAARAAQGFARVPASLQTLPAPLGLRLALRCGETVTGLISAAALVRPTGIEGMQVSSLKKKMKDKAFAASVNREIIRQCADMDMTLEDFLALAIEAMSGKAAELGLVR